MSTPIRGPGDAARPGFLEPVAEVATSKSPVALTAEDTVEARRRSLAAESTVSPRLELLSPSPSVVRERPVEAAVLERVFGVLERLFADPAFVAALTALAALPRLSHVAAAVSGCLVLMTFLNEYLVRGRADPLLLSGALATLGASLAPAGLAQALALTGGAALLARLRAQAPTTQRRTRSRRSSLPSWRSDEELGELMANLGAPGALATALADDDRAAAYGDELEALLAQRDKLRRLKSPAERDQRRLAELDALFEQTLPAAVLTSAAKLAYGREEAPEATPQPGRLWRLPTPTTLEAMVQAIAADASYAELNRLELRHALAAYNGVRDSEALKANDVVYVPTADEAVPPPSGWPEVMPLPSRRAADLRHRLVELAPLVTAGRADGLAGRAARLLHVLDRMPVRPEAYELPHNAEPVPQPA